VTASVFGRRLPAEVTIRDVSPRDGLQNVGAPVPTSAKVALVDDLVRAGVRRIEATSFVSPTAVPQMADAAAVMARAPRKPGLSLEALVPNERGARAAIDAGADALVVIVAVSETFAQRNVNMSVSETLDGLERIAALARAARVPCVASVTTAFGCAYEGQVPLDRVRNVIARCADAGIDEVTLCDTVGMANPGQVEAVLGTLRGHDAAALRLGLHFHDTRGMGLANVLTALAWGIDLFDASLGGIGGCPFAPGATGNVCTEDVVHMLVELGIDAGISLDGLLAAAADLAATLGAPLPGRVAAAGPRWALRAP
jgi:hydroxymethylglutaryl-CoA lyase